MFSKSNIADTDWEEEGIERSPMLIWVTCNFRVVEYNEFEASADGQP